MPNIPNNRPITNYSGFVCKTFLVHVMLQKQQNITLPFHYWLGCVLFLCILIVHCTCRGWSEYKIVYMKNNRAKTSHTRENTRAKKQSFRVTFIDT